MQCHNHKYGQHMPDGVLAAQEGPQLLFAKVKDAARQNWYILFTNGILGNRVVVVLSIRIYLELKLWMLYSRQFVSQACSVHS